jgi:malic enzyme
MNHNAIVFGLTNPGPEILPSDALKADARIVCTGRSDFPNQVNNAVVFPSVFRALLDTRARGLDEKTLVTASYAIASLVEQTHLKKDYVIPKVNDPRILPIVTKTLKEAIGSHELKDGTETRQLHEERTGNKGQVYSSRRDHALSRVVLFGKWVGVSAGKENAGSC